MKAGIDALKHAILGNQQLISTFAGISTEPSEQHIQRVKKGKLLLKLYSTIGTPEIYKWLDSANSTGHFYALGDYLIVKQNSFKKDMVDIKQVSTIIETAKEFSRTRDPGDPHISNVIRLCDGYNIKDAELLLPAMLLYLRKIGNIIYKPEYQIGEIYKRNDQLGNPIPMSLIGLYMSQNDIDEANAIDNLCKLFDIPAAIGENVVFDRRTHWLSHPIPYEEKTLFPTQDYEEMEFKDNERLLGKILLKGNAVIAPVTFWSKKHLCAPIALEIPFQETIPLWNKDLMKNQRANEIVIITDSIPLAYNAYRQIIQEISKLNNELEILQQKEHMAYLGGHDSTFEEELKSYIFNKYKEQIQPIECYAKNCGSMASDAIYIRARLISKVKSSHIKFTTENPYEKAKNIHFFLKLMNSDITGNESSFSVMNILGSEFYVNITNECYQPQFMTVAQYSFFKDAYLEIENYIKTCKEKDSARIKEINDKIKERHSIIWTTWYGGADAAGRLDTSILRDKKVFYLILQHNQQSYQTAYSFYSKISPDPGISATFLDLSHWLSGKEFETAILTHDQLCETAQNKFCCKAPSQAECSYIDSDRPDIYDPKQEMKHENKPVDFLIKPVIEENSITLLYSETNVGKTWFSLSMAQALSLGCDVFTQSSSWSVPSPKRVLIIDSEMSPASFKKRMRILSKMYAEQAEKQESASINGVIEYKLVAGQSWDLTDEEGIYRDKISKWLRLGRKDQINVLILDNLSSLSEFKDTSKSWNNLFSWLQELCQNGCSSIVVHHSNKIGEQRGSGIKSNTVNNIIRLKKLLNSGSTNVAMNVKIEKSRDAFGHALEPFNLMLKTSGKNYTWASAYANKAKNISNKDRDKAILELLNTKAFNQQIIADYFGIEIPTLKGIYGKEKAKIEEEKSRRKNELMNMLEDFELEDEDLKRLGKNIIKLFESTKKMELQDE